MIYTVAFIILIGILVFAHELGHFLMGKLCKVRIEAFSIGFGKPLLHKKVGETDYRISAIPLGGYVKFFGDDEKDGKVDPELKHLTLYGQSVPKKSLIVVAGPVFNFILAGILFAFVYFIGEPNLATIIGYVEPGSTADESGIREGDQVLAVNGQSVDTWNEMDEKISAGNQKVMLTIKREEGIKGLTLPLTEELSRNKYGEIIRKPQIFGIMPNKRSALVGVNDPVSPAFKAGFKTGDLITEVDGKKIETWDEFENALISGNKISKIKIKREKEEIELILSKDTNYKKGETRVYIVVNITTLSDSYYSYANNLGFYPSELFISDFVKKDSPAVKAGMQIGDRMVAVNGKILRTFQSLQQVVDKAGRNDEELNILLEREGALITVKISPKLQNIDQENIGQKDKRFLLGVQTYYYMGPVVEKKIIIRNPIKLIWASTVKTVTWIWITLVGLIKLFTGAVSLKAIGGPLMIGKVAGDSLHLGIVYFLRIMAIISINLGIINLFPIPVLDGGHLMFFGIEAVTGKPLKEKYIMIAQQVGFYLLIGLIVLSFYNDILKYGSNILGMFLGIFK
ncbi:MAG: RIP metalloprotease RseP [Proteobacteria bacterium]|nr:RIP metalloprotease RseP [Pseudomonadota bacterium]